MDEKALEERLNYSFRDPSILKEALTHSSSLSPKEGRGRDNERLEFLGDSVIELVVSHLLYERFPERREGDLSKMRASLVNEESLAKLARKIDLGEALILGKGEERTGGREKDSILSSALEALAAAIYLDGGYKEAERVIRELFLPLIEERGWKDSDYKTQLQEYTQGRYKTVPRYILLKEEGPDHRKLFEVAVTIEGRVWGRGKGRSKKEAEQKAAQEAWERIHAEGA